PRAMTSLLDVAIHATEPETPAPVVLSLARRPPGGIRSGLREMDQRTSPRAPILLTAVEHARGQAPAIETIPRWTSAPAPDIINTALEHDAGWILIGFHKPAFGTDELGGTVRGVLERAHTLPIHVGVVTRGEPGQIDRIFALFDN